MDVLWSPKGGSGTSVVAAALAASCPESVLVDLDGDQPAIWGVGTPPLGWSDVSDRSEPAALASVTIEIATRRGTCAILPRGSSGQWHEGTDAAVSRWMASQADHGKRVVVDGGVVRSTIDGSSERLFPSITKAAGRSLAVVRPCYLALRRLVELSAQVRIDGVVVVREPGRALDEHDVERAVGVDVVGRIDVDPAIARCVDAGLLAHRMPRSLTRSIRGLL